MEVIHLVLGGKIFLGELDNSNQWKFEYSCYERYQSRKSSMRM